MTHAIFLDKTGGPENFALRDHVLASPGFGQIQVKNTAIGLNFIDIYQRTGIYPVALPAILGSEAVGIVSEIGEGVEGFSLGDRVAWLGGGGGYANATNVPAAMAAKLPGVQALGDHAAIGLFLKGLTVEMLVRQVFALKSGHRCLVYAAAGGVGTLLCQWASHIGAHVIGVVGTSDKIKNAEENGARDVIVRDQTKDIAADVRALTDGLGVDVVYDSVGASTFEASLDALALCGHFVTFGNASGVPPAIAPSTLAAKGSLSLTRPILFHYVQQGRLAAMAENVFSLAQKNILSPRIDAVFPLSRIADAHNRLEAGGTKGAIVLTP